MSKISGVELELSLFSTQPLSKGQATTCAELGIPLIAYSPLGRGFLTGKLRSLDDINDIPETDIRRRYPWFQPDVFDENLKLVTEIERVAKKKRVALSQVAIAWVSQLRDRQDMPQVIPIPGCSTVERVEENMKRIELDETDLADIHDALQKIQIKGDRYQPEIMQFSEE